MVKEVIDAPDVLNIKLEPCRGCAERDVKIAELTARIIELETVKPVEVPKKRDGAKMREYQRQYQAKKRAERLAAGK